MSKPSLILLSGFVGSGKTTIGHRYLQDHPLALFVEVDELIVNLGQWSNYEEEASRVTFELAKSLVRKQLSLGYDVIYPYMLLNAEKVAEVEQIGLQAGAQIFDFILGIREEKAIARLLKRGHWGEKGLEPITDQDIPRIKTMYERMTNELPKRPDAIVVDVYPNSIEDSYQQIVQNMTVR